MANDVTRRAAPGTSLDASARLLYIVAGVGIAFNVSGFFEYAHGSREWTHTLWQAPLNLALLGCAVLVGRGKRWAVVAGIVVWCANAVLSWIMWRGVVGLALAVVVVVLIARTLMPASRKQG